MHKQNLAELQLINVIGGLRLGGKFNIEGLSAFVRWHPPVAIGCIAIAEPCPNTAIAEPYPNIRERVMSLADYILEFWRDSGWADKLGKLAQADFDVTVRLNECNYSDGMMNQLAFIDGDPLKYEHHLYYGETLTPEERTRVDEIWRS